MFAERLIEAETLRSTPTGFTTDIRLPWYRSLPLSCVGRITVSVDGTTIPPENIRFSIYDVIPSTVSELAQHTTTYWYVLDSGHLSVESAEAITPGTHLVTVETSIFIPYLPVGGDALVNLDTCSAELEVAA